MAIILLLNEGYHEKPINHMVSFAEKAEHKAGIFAARMCSSNPYVAMHQMKYVKEFIRGEDNKSYAHFVVSSCRFNELTQEALYKLAKQLAKFFSTYQVFIAIHPATTLERNVHFHYIVNLTSYMGGNDMTFDDEIVNLFRNYSERILDERLLTVEQYYNGKKQETNENEE